jgi:hypothetical protein
VRARGFLGLAVAGLAAGESAFARGIRGRV